MGTDLIRRPSASGYLYPAERVALEALIDDAVPAVRRAQPAVGLVAPHSSYARVSRILGATLGAAAIPRRCVVVTPSHTGSWMPWSVMTGGAYRSPLGDLPVDGRFVEALRSRCAFLEADAWAQRGEHGIEVLVPFLQRLGPADLSLVPIVVQTEDAEPLTQLGVAIAQAIRMTEEPTLLIASSDLSHFLPEAETRRMDERLLARVCALDGDGVARVAADERASVCGISALRIVLTACRELGASQGEVCGYTTSGAEGGDPDSSIGYGGIVLR